MFLLYHQTPSALVCECVGVCVHVCSCVYTHVCAWVQWLCCVCVCVYAVTSTWKKLALPLVSLSCAKQSNSLHLAWLLRWRPLGRQSSLADRSTFGSPHQAVHYPSRRHRPGTWRSKWTENIHKATWGTYACKPSRLVLLFDTGEPLDFTRARGHTISYKSGWGQVSITATSSTSRRMLFKMSEKYWKTYSISHT